MFMDRSCTYMRYHERGWNDEFPENFLEEPRTRVSSTSSSSSSSSSNDAPATLPCNECSKDTAVEQLTPVASAQNKPKHFGSSDVYLNAPFDTLTPVAFSENASLHFGLSDDFLIEPRIIQLSDNAPSTSMDSAPFAEPIEFSDLATANAAAEEGYLKSPFADGRKENLSPLSSFCDFDQNPVNVTEYNQPSYNMNQYQPRQQIERYNYEMMNQEDLDNSDDDEYMDQIEETPVKKQPMKEVGQTKHKGTPYERKIPNKPTKKASPVTKLSADPNINWANTLLDTEIPEYVEVDTQQIVLNIRKWQKNCGNIKFNQITFAKNILGRSQGTLSESLSNPKPWELMRHGRALFVKMYNWLKLTDEDKEVIWNMDLQQGKGKKDKIQQKEETPKRAREQIKFTYEQKSYLEKAFNEDSHPKKEQMQKIAHTLELEFATVNNFFTNTRRRQKTYEKKNEIVQN